MSVGDQGYPLKEYLMRPYPTDNGRVPRQKQISNYRLSTARRTAECAFGILLAKWRCLKTELEVNPEHVDAIIRTVCSLHNIIIEKEGVNETDAMTQTAPEDHSNVRRSRSYNRAKKKCMQYTREVHAIF